MKKSFFAFLIIICLLFSLYTMVFSQGNLKKIDVSFKDVNFVGKGGKYNSKGETFYYNGKLYAPVSNLLRVFGGEGLLNEKKNGITLVDYVDIPDCNPANGESFVYGLIFSIDFSNRELAIEQYEDDDSPEIPSKLKVREDVIIILSRNKKNMNIDFSDLNVNDRVGLILDENKEVRGILLTK